MPDVDPILHVSIHSAGPERCEIWSSDTEPRGGPAPAEAALAPCWSVFGIEDFLKLGD